MFVDEKVLEDQDVNQGASSLSLILMWGKKKQNRNRIDNYDDEEESGLGKRHSATKTVVAFKWSH